MNILLVHGWGYDRSVWDDLAAGLTNHTVARVDFGYFGEPDIPVQLEPATLAVGHSLGLLWLLTQTSCPLAGLVSICGFDAFAAAPRHHVRPAKVKAMQLGIDRAPERVLRQFWTSCGHTPKLDAAAANTVRLSAGLTALQSWNGEDRLKALNCRILAIAAKDDEIVNQDMTLAIWPEKSIKWSQDGGHGLPVTKAAWCADEINHFALSL